MTMESTQFVWHDAATFEIEGKGWDDTALPFDRFPPKAEGMTPKDVWDLSRDSAGLSVQFETNASEIRARWRLRVPGLATAAFSALSRSGLDLYGRDATGRWRWVGIGLPNAQEAEATLASGIRAELREYRIYLPLRNPVDSLEIGIPEGTRFRPLPRSTQKPVVYYGTSIVHGIAASRPGMTHASILGRRLDVPMVNLGFSGKGKMEKELAILMSEIDAALYILDTLPNMEAPMIDERAEPFIRFLREARPNTPIVLIEDRTYGNSWIRPYCADRNRDSRKAFRAIYERLVNEGMTGLHYIEGAPLLGDDDEATVDSSHPNDLGFARMADALEPVLRPLISGVNTP